MKTLALDMSSKSTGWAIFEEQQLIDYGCITCSSTDSLKRIKKITIEIEKVYKKYIPENIICEEVILDDVHHNHNVFKVLIYLQASVALMFHTYNKKLEFFVSSEWRKICGIRTGRGITRDTVKVADIKFVKDNYGLDVNDDIADAICIGYAYTHPIKTTRITEDGFEFK